MNDNFLVSESMCADVTNCSITDNHLFTDLVPLVTITSSFKITMFYILIMFIVCNIKKNYANNGSIYLTTYYNHLTETLY